MDKKTSKVVTFIFAQARRLFLLVIMTTLIQAQILFHTGSGAAAGVLEENNGKLPFFQDDFPLETLSIAIVNSLDYLDKQPADRKYRLCGRSCSSGRLKESLRTMLNFLQMEKTPAELHGFVIDNFDICRAGGDEASGRVRVTAYYEPVFQGRTVKNPPYIYPVYSTPSDLVVLPGYGGGQKRTGRLKQGRLLPYWTREQIDSLGMLAGNELVYLADPVEVFILHVQGSGMIQLEDGVPRPLHYAASNGRPYRSIGRLLAARTGTSPEDMNLPAIKRYLRDHPLERQEILNYNESFVFFKWDTDIGHPRGCLDEPLTPGRSVALDQSVYPAGALGFLLSRRPVFDEHGRLKEWRPLSRFVLNQDSGSAITGGARLDLFWGSGDDAGRAAGMMNCPGRLYFLVKKDQGSRRTGQDAE